MKSISRFTQMLICISMLSGGIATAQDLQQQLSKLGHDAAIGYVTPILSGWGNDLNSGIYYSADLHSVLGFDIGVKFAMSRFSNADKTYSFAIPSMSIDPSILGITSINGVSLPAGTKINLVSGVNYPSSITANSAVGPKDNAEVKTIDGTNATISAPGSLLNGQTIAIPAQTIFTLPGGFDISALGVPIVIPQFDLGLPFGLELMLRYVPTISAGDAGKFNYMGFGLRYDIDQFIPFCPVDIAVHFITQKMNFKSKDDNDIFSATGTACGLEVSKKFAILTLYGGLQLEGSSLTLADYKYEGNDPLIPQGMTIQGFEVKGSDKSRFNIGARVLLLFINVYADYSFATNNVLTLGAGISIR